MDFKKHCLSLPLSNAQGKVYLPCKNWRFKIEYFTEQNTHGPDTVKRCINFSEKYFLTHFWSTFPFYTPWKFSRRYKMETLVSNRLSCKYLYLRSWLLIYFLDIFRNCLPEMKYFSYFNEFSLFCDVAAVKILIEKTIFVYGIFSCNFFTISFIRYVVCSHINGN